MSPLTLPLPRNVMALSLTPSPGMHVSEAVEVICLIARTTNIKTSVVFNGFLMTADPHYH